MIRKALRTDISDLKRLLSTIDLFPPEMLEDQMADYLENPSSQDNWLVATHDQEVTGFCFCSPEELTDRTYNLLAIGVRKDRQGRGIGRQLVQALEAQLTRQGGRILLVDTSGTDEFRLTRKFYEQLAYRKESVIRDYWAEGDDKVTYWKKLAG